MLLLLKSHLRYSQSCSCIAEAGTVTWQRETAVRSGSPHAATRIKFKHLRKGRQTTHVLGRLQRCPKGHKSSFEIAGDTKEGCKRGGLGFWSRTTLKRAHAFSRGGLHKVRLEEAKATFCSHHNCPLSHSYAPRLSTAQPHQPLPQNFLQILNNSEISNFLSSHDDANGNRFRPPPHNRNHYPQSHNGKGSAQVRSGRWPPERSRMSHLVEDLCVAVLKFSFSSPPLQPGRA